MGNCAIWIKNDEMPLTQVTPYFHEGGFKVLNFAVNVTEIAIMSKRYPGENSRPFKISEFRYYPLPNLLEGAKIFLAPKPTKQQKSAENLVKSLHNRSARNDFAPIVSYDTTSNKPKRADF